jgi:hypothetical protein
VVVAHALILAARPGTDLPGEGGGIDEGGGTKESQNRDKSRHEPGHHFGTLTFSRQKLVYSASITLWND